MTSLKAPAPKGQVFLEAIVTSIVLFMTIIGGASLILHGFGLLLLTKWAASNSNCIALQEPIQTCERKTAEELSRNFAFHHVSVHTKIVRGIIHSEVTGTLIDRLHVHSSYDVGPTEYKRVSQ